mgnify:CR=1 FL=1
MKIFLISIFGVLGVLSRYSIEERKRMVFTPNSNMQFDSEPPSSNKGFDKGMHTKNQQKETSLNIVIPSKNN